jgi:O-antigen/teichoic acid export membrane protein
MEARQKAPGFARSTLVVAGGAALGQAILLIATPVLSRLYSPTEFGFWTVLLSTIAPFQVVANGRYELAIMLPEDDEEAANVFGLTVVVASALSALLLVAVFVGRTWISGAMGVEALASWLWTLPLVVFLTGLYQAGLYWASRKGSFGSLGVARIGVSAAMVGTQVGAGVLARGGAGWLIAGSVIGQLVGTCMLAIQVLRLGMGTLRRSLSWRRMWGCAVRYRNFPFFNVPYVFTGVLRDRLLILLLSAHASAHAVGLYSMANKLSYVPVGLVGMSMSVVFFRKAAAEADPSVLGTFVVGTMRRMALMGAPLVVLFLFNVDWVFGAVLGSRWEESARYAQFLAFPAFLALLSTWLDRILDVLGRQRLALLMEVIFGIASLGAFGVAMALLKDPQLAVAAYCAALALCYVAWFAVVFRVASFSLAGLRGAGAVFLSVTAAAAVAHGLAVALLGRMGGFALMGVLCLGYYVGVFRAYRRSPST